MMITTFTAQDNSLLDCAAQLVPFCDTTHFQNSVPESCKGIPEHESSAQNSVLQNSLATCSPPAAHKAIGRRLEHILLICSFGLENNLVVVSITHKHLSDTSICLS